MELAGNKKGREARIIKKDMDWYNNRENYRKYLLSVLENYDNAIKGPLARKKSITQLGLAVKHLSDSVIKNQKAPIYIQGQILEPNRATIIDFHISGLDPLSGGDEALLESTLKELRMNKVITGRGLMLKEKALIILGFGGMLEIPEFLKRQNLS